MSKKEPKVAIVHDWLVGYAGGDRVVDAMKHVFPNAVIYTLVYDPKNMPEWFKSYDIRTSWFQKVPFSNKLYKAMLPLMPGAFEAFDLTEYDLVLSSSSSCSKGVITRPDAVHICYCHTPTRYVWDFYYTYRNNANALVRAVMPGQMLKLRQWDKCAADRVDYFIANSHYIAKRIKKYYRRDSDVIYPCVHINEEPFVPKEDFYHQAEQAADRDRRRRRGRQAARHGWPDHPLFGRRPERRRGARLLSARQGVPVPRRGGFWHYPCGSPERRHPGAGLWPRRRL